jgi:hypothetical protein
MIHGLDSEEMGNSPGIELVSHQKDGAFYGLGHVSTIRKT